MTMGNIEQVKKILENKNITIEEQTVTDREDRWDAHSGQMLPNDAKELATEIAALYEPQVCPKPEQMMICPKIGEWGNEPCPHRNNDFPFPKAVPTELQMLKRECRDCWQEKSGVAKLQKGESQEAHS